VGSAAGDEMFLRDFVHESDFSPSVDLFYREQKHAWSDGSTLRRFSEFMPTEEERTPSASVRPAPPMETLIRISAAKCASPMVQARSNGIPNRDQSSMNHFKR